MALVPRSMPLIAQVAAVVIWSTTFVVSADALSGISPALLTVVRFVLAAAVLVPLAAMRRGLLRALASPVSAVLGLTGVAAYYGLQNLGLSFTTPGTAALLQAVIPVAAAVLSFLLLRERPGVGSGIGLVLATVGVIVAASTNASFNVGAALIATGAACYAVYTVLLRRLEMSRGDDAEAPRTDPVVVAAATAVWGVVFLLPWQIGEAMAGQTRLDLTPSLTLALLYLGVIASGATLLLWTYGAGRTPAITSGILTAAIPALGYGFALAMGEDPTWNKTIGGLIALLGVGVAIAGSRVRPPAAAEVLPLAVPAATQLFPEDGPDQPDHQPRRAPDGSTHPRITRGGPDRQSDDGAEGKTQQER